MKPPALFRGPLLPLAGWSVTGKIAAGFATVLALHLSVVALGHYGVRKADRDREAQETLLTQVETFFEIDRMVSELQQNVMQFAHTGYEGSTHRVEALQVGLALKLKQASGSTEAAVDPGLIASMERSLKRHREIFESVVVDRAKRREIKQVQLVRCDRDFDAAIGALQQREESPLPGLDSARAAFHTAQLNALRFVGDPDSALVRDVKANLEETRRHLLDASHGSGQDMRAAMAAVDRFGSAFIQMVQSTRGYLHLVNVVLAGESAEFLHQAREVRNACSERADDLTEAMRRDSQRFERVNNAVSVLTILLGLVASWLIGRDVAPPLNDITKTIDGLAHGERCQSIPGLDRRDELGRLARAAEVFRAKAAETERLLEEVTRMKEAERQASHSQKMESLGQLAAGIAHEINTPMQSVANNMQFLAGATQRLLSTLASFQAALTEPDAGSVEWRERLLEKARERRFVKATKQMPEAIAETASASERVVEIVRAMKAMSHPGSSNLEATDVNQVVRDATTISRNRWKYAAALQLELDENLPSPPALSSVLSQVVLNLVVNAADAIVENSSPGDNQGCITVRTYADAESVFLEVQDTGGGVPEHLKQRIFEPFFTTKEVGKGTGQGLSFCYNAVVKRHRGDLRLDSVPGVGATFTIRLPLVPAAADEGASCSLDGSPVLV